MRWTSRTPGSCFATRVMSAMGESFRSTCGHTSSSSGISGRTFGEQSSRRKTFPPPVPRRAGSKNTTSGLKSPRISAMLPGTTSRQLNLTFSTPSSLKLCLAASTNDSFISLYKTSSATSANAHESTPIPPVISATRRLGRGAGAQVGSLGMEAASAALWRAAGSPEDCSAERGEG